MTRDTFLRKGMMYVHYIGKNIYIKELSDYYESLKNIQMHTYYANLS